MTRESNSIAIGLSGGGIIARNRERVAFVLVHGSRVPKPRRIRSCEPRNTVRGAESLRFGRELCFLVSFFIQKSDVADTP